MPRPSRSFLSLSALYVYAALVGVAGAFCARGFQMLVNLLRRGAFGRGGGILEVARGLPFWMRLAVPVAGAVVAAVIVRWLARQTSAFGVADLMEVVSLRKLRVHPRTTLARCVSSAFELATGGSVGR